MTIVAGVLLGLLSRIEERAPGVSAGISSDGTWMAVAFAVGAGGAAMGAAGERWRSQPGGTRVAAAFLLGGVLAVEGAAAVSGATRSRRSAWSPAWRCRCSAPRHRCASPPSAPRSGCC